MQDYAFTNHRVIQWMGIILAFGLIAVGYWYFQVYAGYKTNISPTGSLTSGLVGYWTFDGADISGTTATDRGSGGNNGTLTNTPQITQGKNGQALDFDGTDDFVTIADDVDLDFGDTADFTISGWFNRDTDTTTDMVVTKKNGLTSSHTGYAVYIDATSDKLVLEICDGADEYLLTSSTAFAAGSGWVHFITIWDQDSVTGSEIYINGIANNAVDSGDAIASLGDLSQTIDLRVGAEGDDGNPFDGKIDDVRIYNRILSTTEIQSLYALAASDPINTGASQPQGTGRLDSGLAGYWAMDDGSGTSATDSSTNANTGTLTNGPTWTTGQIGSAVTFDGSDDYISAGTDSSLRLTNSLSVSAWIYIASHPANGETRRIVYKHSNADSSFLYSFGIFRNGGSTILRFTPGGGGGNVNGSTALSSGRWYHVAVTFDLPAINFYIDGVLDSTGSSSVGGGFASGSGTMYIGGINSADTTVNGNLDEVRVYNRLLSGDEMADLYRLTSPTSVETSLKGYWSFNGKDVSGTTTYDRSGAGNTGTLTNGPTVTPGKLGQALNFASTSSQSVSITSHASLQSSVFTYVAWVNPATNSGEKAIYGTSSSGPRFAVGVGSGAGTLKLTQTGVSTIAETAALIPLNTWSHAAVTYDASGNYIFYVNGVSVLSGTDLRTFAWSTMNIGQTSSNYFNGSIDEVRVYNTALSAAQIQSLYKQGQSDEVNTGASQPQGGSRLDSGLAGYWALDNGSGTSATDSSTNGSAGTLTNGPTWTTGQVVNAVDFDGTDDYISVADSSALDITQAITLSAWVKGDSWANTEANFIIAKNDNDGVERRNYQLYVNTSGNLGFGFDDNSVSGSLFSTTTLSTGQWYFVTATYDRQNIKLYENGVLVRTTAETDVMTANTNLLSIGRAQRNNGTDYGEWDGFIDEARVYSRALSGDEVAQLYRLSTPTGTETGLKGYWSFNGKDVSGTSVYDRSGAGNTGTTSGSPSVTPGKIGQGIALDGSDDYVSIADASSIDYDYNQDFSFSVWVKLPSTQADTSGGDNFIVEKWSGSTGYPYTLRVYNQTYGTSGDRGKVVFRRYDGTNAPVVTSTSLLNDNNWHHVVGTKSGSTLRLYIDGASQGTTTDTTTTTTTNTSPLYIGTRGGSTNNLTGSVDELRLYNRVLSATEVAALYNNR